MTAPLTGIRVLDLTNVLAGPFACHQLVHLGAEVIKVEAVGRGDLARNLGSDPALNAAGMGISFLAQNAGKKSVSLNLKDPRGKDLLFELIKTADVLVENFRPGVMDRLGLDYETLKAVTPSLIYCAISGFGQDGPWVKRPAYDQIIQGASGLMSVTGDSASAPTRVGSPVADTVGGLTAAMAISAALNAQPRGCMIDVSMLESVLATMGWVLSNHLIGGQEPAANGNENPTSAPSGTFRTGEGLLNIAANKDEQWLLLCQHLERDDLLTHPDYRTREDRKANRLALRAELETNLSAKSALDWEAELNALGIPSGAVLTVPQVLNSDHLQSRDFLEHFPSTPGVDRAIRVVSTGLKIDGQRPKVTTPPPALGADEAEIWGALGLDAAALQALRKDGVI
jgi:crotonobetainyl-CoA:carnitine CoA-transferase CaiB-like acyl-CoA transferase